MSTTTELIDATAWGEANTPDENLIFKSGMWQQIMFVRDRLARMLAKTVDHTHEEYRYLVKVCGDHHSKSVTLPVFSIDWKRGVRFTLRNNFYDWGVSVQSIKPIVWDFDGLFDRAKVDSYLEGFPDDRKFSTYDADPSRFTFGVRDDFDLYAVMFLIARQFPARPAAGQQEGKA